MKTKIFTILVMAIGLLASTNAFADNETVVSINSTITYTVSPTLGSGITAANYAWTLGSGGAIASGDGTNTITVTWSTAGTHTLSVQLTDSNGCLSEPISIDVTVNDSKWDLAAETNTTTCSLLTDNSSGNNQSTPLADETTFQVSITNPLTGDYIVDYQVSDGTTTATYSVNPYDESAPETITIGHAADGNLIAIFNNTGDTAKTVTVTVTKVTDPNGSEVTLGTKNSYTVTVNPKPIITGTGFSL